MSRSDHRELRNSDLKLGWVVVVSGGGGWWWGWVYSVNADTAPAQLILYCAEQSLSRACQLHNYIHQGPCTFILLPGLTGPVCHSVMYIQSVIDL